MVQVHLRVPRDSPDYHGPILVNPGGPGGSGVDLVLKAGPLLSTILGPGFDIIGFDPRGMLDIYKRSPALRAGSYFCRNDRLKAEFKGFRQTDGQT
jgi:hypothetical protein